MAWSYCFLVAWQDQPPSHITDEELALVINTCWCLLHAHYGFIEPARVPLSASALHGLCQLVHSIEEWHVAYVWPSKDICAIWRTCPLLISLITRRYI